MLKVYPGELALTLEPLGGLSNPKICARAGGFIRASWRSPLSRGGGCRALGGHRTRKVSASGGGNRASWRSPSSHGGGCRAPRFVQGLGGFIRASWRSPCSHGVGCRALGGHRTRKVSASGGGNRASWRSPSSHGRVVEPWGPLIPEGHRRWRRKPGELALTLEPWGGMSSPGGPLIQEGHRRWRRKPGELALTLEPWGGCRALGDHRSRKVSAGGGGNRASWRSPSSHGGVVEPWGALIPKIVQGSGYTGELVFTLEPWGGCRTVREYCRTRELCRGCGFIRGGWCSPSSHGGVVEP